jgi:Zn-dependent protease/CBS domain-containing protein
MYAAGRGGEDAVWWRMHDTADTSSYARGAGAGRGRAAGSGPGGRGRGPFASTIVLGHVAGIEIGVNWTWLGIFALLVWSLAGVEFPADAPGRSWPVYAVMGVAATTAFFGSLILHELGHALQARREGVRTEGITLWLFGGVAKIAGSFPSAWAEFRIAVAGPLVSLAIGLAAVAAAWADPQPGAVRTVLAWLGYINLALLVFNLIPALPLDGGRVLRSLLWARTGDLARATRRAARVGATLAAVLIGIGLLETLTGALGGLWLALIGWFVLEAGRAEQQQVLAHDVLDRVPVSMLMTGRPVTVDPEQSLAQVAFGIRGTARHTAYPVVRGDRPVGLLALHSLTTTPHELWEMTRVQDCMIAIRDVPQLEPGLPASAAMQVLAHSPIRRALVLDAAGRLVGILSLTDLARALAAQRAI